MTKGKGKETAGSKAAALLARMRAESLSAEERAAIASKAGKARLTKLTAERRREIARKASQARWAKRRRKKKASGKG